MIFMETVQQDDGYIRSVRYQMCKDNGTEMAHAGISTRMTRYAGGWIPTMTVGGVGTSPQYRRQGAVRALLEKLMPAARENGWYVSILHPFSFSFYRKFGYEDVSEIRRWRIPLASLPKYELGGCVRELIGQDNAAHIGKR